MEEMYDKDVFSDEAFVKELFELEEPWEVQAALKEKGIEMTEEEIISLRDEIVKLLERAAESGELTLEQLEEAAGGGVAFTISLLLGLSAIGGITIGVGTGALGAGMFAAAGLITGIRSRRW